MAKSPPFCPGKQEAIARRLSLPLKVGDGSDDVLAVEAITYLLERF